MKIPLLIMLVCTAGFLYPESVTAKKTQQEVYTIAFHSKVGEGKVLAGKKTIKLKREGNVYYFPEKVYVKKLVFSSTESSDSLLKSIKVVAGFEDENGKQLSPSTSVFKTGSYPILVEKAIKSFTLNEEPVSSMSQDLLKINEPVYSGMNCMVYFTLLDHSAAKDKAAGEIQSKNGDSTKFVVSISGARNSKIFAGDKEITVTTLSAGSKLKYIFSENVHVEKLYLNFTASGLSFGSGEEGEEVIVSYDEAAVEEVEKARFSVSGKNNYTVLIGKETKCVTLVEKQFKNVTGAGMGVHDSLKAILDGSVSIYCRLVDHSQENKKAVSK